MDWREFQTATGLVGHESGDGGRAVVVLHGGPGMSDYTAPLCEEIAAGGDGALRLARYQQRGQAPSTSDGPLTIEQFVADVVEVIDHLGTDEAILAGHSWGAHLAMQVAADRPERVAALLLVDPLGGIGDGGTGTMDGVIQGRLTEQARDELARLPTLGLAPDQAATREIRLIWPGYFADPQSAPPMPDDLTVWPPVGAELWPTIADRFAAGHLATALPTFDKPALYQVGRHSPIDPAANVATAALFPNGILEELDCGHFPWIELPGSVTAATRRLLAKL